MNKGRSEGSNIRGLICALGIGRAQGALVVNSGLQQSAVSDPLPKLGRRQMTLDLRRTAKYEGFRRGASGNGTKPSRSLYVTH